MSIDVLKTAIGRRPFEPFQLIMSSGERYTVKHCETALLVKGGMFVGIPPETDDLPEKAVYCSALHITAVEMLATA